MKAIRATNGEATMPGRPMKYAHGQHAAYVLDRCRCPECKVANSAYERERAQRIEPAYVSAQPAREHVEFLRSRGVGLKTVAKESGVPHGSLSKLIYGDPQRGSAPSQRVRHSTSERILAVMPSQAPTVPAAPTWGLIDEMVTAGVTKTAVARYIGQTCGGLQLSRRFVMNATAAKVREMHALWMSGDLVLRERGHRNVPRPARVVPPRRQIDRSDRAAILDELAGILEATNDQEWRQSAACRNRPPYIWFPADKDRVTAAKAIAVCNACTVRRECLAAHLREEDGIFGGLTPVERRVLIRSRRAS